MENIQFLSIIGANIVLTMGCIGTTITLFLWARSEANNDRRDMNDRLQASLTGITSEMKDFHNRLCDMQPEKKKTNKKNK